MNKLECLLNARYHLDIAIRKEQIEVRRKAKKKPMDESLKLAIEKRDSKLFKNPPHGKH